MGEKLKKKPKFRVGQVVAIRNGYMRQAQYFKITGFRMGKDVMHARFGNYDEAALFAMRPLTARERGPRRPAARGERGMRKYVWIGYTKYRWRRHYRWEFSGAFKSYKEATEWVRQNNPASPLGDRKVWRYDRA